jgi:hypothetical protein
MDEPWLIAGTRKLPRMRTRCAVDGEPRSYGVESAGADLSVARSDLVSWSNDQT